ncbi:hypothetical protein MFLAVUS_003778 [Mucor flavus]|uniref:Chromo domain-containing protein n=1 Tax=Mucor flavus TaxID=439312 RepID=A0ABP9YU19_9FUNG
MNKDNLDMAPSVEEEYEVEKIVGHRIVKTKNVKSFKYYIKWLNYDEKDNTWEKEADVFAFDIIAQYWSSLPKTDKDRILFETLQSKKKNPIILSSPTPKVAKVITASPSPSPPSSPTLQPVDNKPTLVSFFATNKRIESDKRTSASSSSSSSVADKSELHQSKIADSYSSVSNHNLTTKSKQKVTNATTTLDRGKEKSKAVVEEEEESRKRTRRGYTDYFTEQHKKSKRSSVSPTLEEMEVEKSETNELETIIFDESFGTDPSRDWDELAVTVEYIGRETKGAPLHCAVKWKGDVVSLHSIALVRKKRPDLVIDAFIKRIDDE